MNRKPIPSIILLIITLWCNYTQAQSKPDILRSNNPSTCNGSEGSFSFFGLLPNTTYQVTYNDDGKVTGPATLTSNAAGELTLPGLNAGIYNNFIFDFNGSIRDTVLRGQRLSNPVDVPSFNSFAAFCAGSTPPVLPAQSNEKINGTWNPSVVNGQASGTYTFTPAPGTCGIPVTLDITVIPIKTAGFPFGTSLTICENGTVPLLPNTDTNSIPVTGTWTQAVVDRTRSNSYVFTPTSGGCVAGTRFDVTVNPIRTTTFLFGTNATICEGADVVTLPAQSSEGITGTWALPQVSKTTSGTYTFTPNPDQCGTTATYRVTVNPKKTPTFTQVGPFCSGTSFTLPGSSGNGINGTWSPAINTTTTTTYTFTPAADECAETATMTVTITPKKTPTFTQVGPFCSGTSFTLPGSSGNGINGTWSPAINTTTTTTYTFTPAAGECAETATMTVTITPKKTPTFTQVGPICSGTSFTLPGSSGNGINGTWSPAINTTTTTTYTFTPAAGECAETATMTVTITPKKTPTFTQVGPICSGTSFTLPGSSGNGINGTWSPAINTTTTTTYTFTPAAGECAETATMTVTITPKKTPTFTQVGPFCSGTSFTLPGSSGNGINGTWSPAVNTTTTTTYTFTPAAGECAETATMTVTITPKKTPTFTQVGPFCSGTSFTLPGSSGNGINGTWSPAINTTTTTTYTFTPAAGECAETTTMTVTITPKKTPTFTQVGPICSGTSFTLPGSSGNGINGAWSPAVNTTTTTTYTFTPAAGECAETTTMTVTITPKKTPTFTQVGPICSGTSFTLPGSSGNGINGAWSPAVNTTTTTTYTFTPAAGECAETATMTVTITPKKTPTFTQVGPICSGTSFTLPGSSGNGINGTWSPAINTTTTTTYTFTPAAGECAETATMTVTITPKKTPTFTQVGPICNGISFTLPGSSGNGINGTWSPAINTTTTTTYTFTPAAGECAETATMMVTITPRTTPTFTPVAPICTGGTLTALPITSNNGITGTWAPALNNTATTTYTFTPTAGQCATTTTLTITVNQKVTPTFAAAARICSGDTLATLPTISTNVTPVTGTWSPAINNTATTTYTFTPDMGQCAMATTFTMQVNPVPALVNIVRDTTVNDGTVLAPNNFGVDDPAGSIRWNNSNPAIGLPASGTGAVPSFTATNTADTPYTAIITTIPFIKGCAGVSQSFKITVFPLTKDIFVPNIFSPDGNGKNRQFLIYGNSIVSVDMQIFNQWGQRLATITDTHQGWDGKYKGIAQPVGVYLYVLKAVLKDGRKIRMKGSVTLIR